MYADKVTRSMDFAIKETNRRRLIQDKYNHENGIEPRSIQKAVRDLTDDIVKEEKQIESIAFLRNSFMFTIRVSG